MVGLFALVALAAVAMAADHIQKSALAGRRVLSSMPPLANPAAAR